MFRSIRTLRLIASTTLLAFGLVACGGTTAPAPTTAPVATIAAEPTVATVTEATPEPTVAPAIEATPEPTVAAVTEATPEPTADASSVPPTVQAAPTAIAAPKLNLNTLTEDQLISTIPNFPNRMVREFFEYRPYISILQFRQEIGKYVSTEQVAAYEQYVFVPIDVDQSDAATLQQIPGIDATIADALIAGRPYGSNEAFLAKLTSAVPSIDIQMATSMLVTE